MKSLLLKAAVVGVMALPLTAATKTPKPVPTWGGYAKGYKFSLPVTYKLSSAVTLNGVPKDVPVPAGVPKFNVSQNVSFTIGPKGELTATGMKLPYSASSGTMSNSYVSVPTRANPQANTGLLFKNSSGSPSALALTFYTVKIAKFVPTVTTVVYTLGNM